MKGAGLARLASLSEEANDCAAVVIDVLFFSLLFLIFSAALISDAVATETARPAIPAELAHHSSNRDSSRRIIRPATTAPVAPYLQPTVAGTTDSISSNWPPSQRPWQPLLLPPPPPSITTTPEWSST